MPSREVVAFLSTDQFSRQFVAKPATKWSITDNVIFQEAWSIYMGTPSPVCQKWVGLEFTTGAKTVRQYVLDEHGDVLGTTGLHGNAHKERHDKIKWLIVDLAAWCGYQLHVEVQNLFLPYIKQRERKPGEINRRRQGIIPDLHDVARGRLMDVKTLAFTRAWYKPIRFLRAAKCETVMKRGASVNGEVRASARRIDEVHNGWPKSKPTPGPVATRLASFGKVEGLAVGAHGKVSPHLIQLIQRMAKRGAVKLQQDIGIEDPKIMQGVVLRQIRAALGVEGIRGMAMMRVCNLGVVVAGRSSMVNASRRKQASRSLYKTLSEAYWRRHMFWDT